MWLLPEHTPTLFQEQFPVFVQRAVPTHLRPCGLGGIHPVPDAAPGVCGRQSLRRHPEAPPQMLPLCNPLPFSEGGGS